MISIQTKNELEEVQQSIKKLQKQEKQLQISIYKEIMDFIYNEIDRIKKFVLDYHYITVNTDMIILPSCSKNIDLNDKTTYFFADSDDYSLIYRNIDYKFSNIRYNCKLCGCIFTHEDEIEEHMFNHYIYNEYLYNQYKKNIHKIGKNSIYDLNKDYGKCYTKTIIELQNDFRFYEFEIINDNIVHIFDLIINNDIIKRKLLKTVSLNTLNNFCGNKNFVYLDCNIEFLDRKHKLFSMFNWNKEPVDDNNVFSTIDIYE
ncbi:hypothetical protein [Acidithiobacillus sp.]|uniref:hypothetical protein n=1 Tax=Acidithiobacillus sp. TaxID=1872118 RepID=UPI00356782F6